MTRHKRRKFIVFAKVCALISIPLIAAVSAKGLPLLVDFMKNTELRKSSYVRCETQSYREKNSGTEIHKDTLTADFPISVGYNAPYDRDINRIHLKSPLEMVSENPGEKPYPVNWSEGGEIIRNTYGKYTGVSFFDLEKCGQVNNRTDIPNEELLEESRYKPNFTISDTDEPQVLIYHTHTTESFEPFVREHYDRDFNYRTTDDTKNIVMVGNAIQAELEAAGIGVIHAVNIHDYPSYNGSYGRSRETIIPILEQNPSIKVALDIHRDAISSEGTAYQPFVEIDGREAAQIMIISGCDDGTMDMPEYIKNFHFACALQQRIEGDFSGLTRPILFDYRHYNQDLTTGSLLIEVGSHGNTLEQVQYSGQLIGRSLAALLNDLKEKR